MSEVVKYQEQVIQTYSKRIPELFRNTVKIRDVDETNEKIWKNVRYALNACALIAGTEQPDNEAYPILKKLLISEFKDFSPEEIVMAFYKKASGALEVKKEHYGKLSGEYIGTVLKAYKNYRDKQLGEELRNENKLEDSLEPDTEQKKQIRYHYIQECFLKPYNALKLDSNKFDRTSGLYWFQFMWKNEIIKVSKSDVDKYKKKATLAVEMLESAKSKNSRGIVEIKRKLKEIELGMENDLLQKIKNEACYLYFLDWCKESIKSGLDIEQFLETNKFYEV